MKRLPVFVNKTLCTSCGGRCCKSAPGSTSPKDWGAPNRKVMQRRLREAFKTGLWCIDWWEGDPRTASAQARSVSHEINRAYYVRPAMVGHVGEVMHAGWNGQCSRLTPKGCELLHGDRPMGCRGLRPIASMECVPAYATKQQMAVAWLPYHGVLREIGLFDSEADVGVTMLNALEHILDGVR